MSLETTANQLAAAIAPFIKQLRSELTALADAQTLNEVQTQRHVFTLEGGSAVGIEAVAYRTRTGKGHRVEIDLILNTESRSES